MNHIPGADPAAELERTTARLERSRRHARVYACLAGLLAVVAVARMFSHGKTDAALGVASSLLAATLTVSILRDMSGTLLGLSAETTPYPRTLGKPAAIALQLLVLCFFATSILIPIFR